MNSPCTAGIPTTIHGVRTGQAAPATLVTRSKETLETMI